MPFEFTPVDEPTQEEVDRQEVRRVLRPSDTQTLRMGHCKSCGRVVHAAIDEPMPELCPKCDDDLMAARVALYLEGRHPTRSRSKLDE